MKSSKSSKTMKIIKQTTNIGEINNTILSELTTSNYDVIIPGNGIGKINICDLTLDYKRINKSYVQYLKGDWTIKIRPKYLSEFTISGYPSALLIDVTNPEMDFKVAENYYFNNQIAIQQGQSMVNYNITDLYRPKYGQREAERSNGTINIVSGTLVLLPKGNCFSHIGLLKFYEKHFEYANKIETTFTF